MDPNMKQLSVLTDDRRFILTKLEMKYYINHSYKNGEKTGLRNNEIFFMRFGNGYDHRGVAVFCIS
jgi:hypothetical protein